MSPLALVLIKLAILAAPLALLAWRLRVFPRKPLVWTALAPALLSFGLLAAPGMTVLVAGIDVVLALIVLGDLLTLPKSGAFSVERETGRISSLRKPHPVVLMVNNHARRAYHTTVRDGVPHVLGPEPAEFDITLSPQRRSVFHYTLHPGRRGAFSLNEVHLRAASRLGLWQRQLSCVAENTLHVYPDMQQLGQYAVLARTNRLSLLGVRRARRIGQDNEFERLRDYTIDDNYKHLDWRATARRRKLTVRDYQASQSQRIIFLVDCGRMMTSEAAGLSLLDHALNAMLMLGYVALRQNDSVGLIAFSNRIHEFVPPRSGPGQMNRLLHASFNRFPHLVESRYDQAFRHLGEHCRKRSLVVLITSVIDEVNAAQLETHLSHLVGRHLPLGVLLRDRRLFDAVENEHPPEPELWPAAAAAGILAWRHQVLADLASKGVLALDVFPEDMTAPLVNRYLEIKARHLL